MNTPPTTSPNLRPAPIGPGDRRPLRAGRRAGFSLVELLVALTISATLLTATMVALDVMFKRYTMISDTASTHVVARTVMHRILSMIRTGREFGPFPTDVLSPSQNPIVTDNIEFLSREDTAANLREVTRIERRSSATIELNGETVQLRGPFTIWLVVETTTNGVTTTRERPLLDGVANALFTLEYTPGPRLRRATVDLIINPRGSEFTRWDSTQQAWMVSKYDERTSQWVEQRMTGLFTNNPTIRLVATAGPRSLE
jgi:prepilin-type N-terminal cleavage/methylation domain-containing protein